MGSRKGLAENTIDATRRPASKRRRGLRGLSHRSDDRIQRSERSDLDAGDTGDGRSDTPMDMAMEMATVATSIAAETAGATIFEPMERINNGKWRRRSEAPAAPSDWRSRMERTIRQQAQELTQLHRTVGHLGNLLEARTAREEAQW